MLSINIYSDPPPPPPPGQSAQLLQALGLVISEGVDTNNLLHGLDRVDAIDLLHVPDGVYLYDVLLLNLEYNV